VVALFPFHTANVALVNRTVGNAEVDQTAVTYTAKSLWIISSLGRVL